jgi:hypothetical protein
MHTYRIYTHIHAKYAVNLSGEAKPSIYEVIVEAEDEIASKMREFLNQENLQSQAQKTEVLDRQISSLIDEIEERKRCVCVYACVCVYIHIHTRTYTENMTL